MTNVIVQSISRATADLPTLIKWGNIPQDKREIPTPSEDRQQDSTPEGDC